MRRRTTVGVAVLVLAAPIYFLGRAGAVLHVKTMTGREVVGTFRCWNCHGPGGALSFESGRPHADPRRLVAGPDGDQLFTTCGPLHKVARIDPGDRASVLSPDLLGRPRDVALSPDGHTLAVTLGETDEVVLLDATRLQVESRIGVGVEPAGLVYADGGRRLVVANAASGDISIVDPAAGAELLRVRGGREPFAAAVSPDGRTVAVVSRMVGVAPPSQIPASELTLLDAASGRVVRRIPLTSSHLAEDLAFTPDGRHVLVPALLVRNLLPILQVARGWVMSSVVWVVETDTGRAVPLPLGDLENPFPDPSAIAIDGMRVWVTSGGRDEVAVVDLGELLATAREAAPGAPEDLSVAHRYLPARFAVGRNPRALASAGELLAVAERLDDNVSLFSADGRRVARIAVGPPVPPDAVHRGDAVFHDARYAFQGSFSCRSCHPGGHTDGLTYDFDIDGVGRNVVLNRSLRGVAGTAPFKWIGLNPNLERQCGPRFAMVLTRADPFPEEKLEDLVAYIQSMPPPRPDPRSGQLAGQDTGAVERGRVLFERTVRKDGTSIPPEGRCVFCHRPPHYSTFLKADVSTRGPLDSTGEFDIPHLTGIGSKAPYLHDGRATTLEEIWTAPGVGDSHGAVSDLTKADLNDLIEFLRRL